MLESIQQSRLKVALLISSTFRISIVIGCIIEIYKCMYEVYYTRNVLNTNVKVASAVICKDTETHQFDRLCYKLSVLLLQTIFLG